MFYDKIDVFNFPIVNFPFICSNISIWSIDLTVFLYIRVSGFYHDFLGRVLLITRKLLNHGFLVAMLKSSLQKFYCRPHDLVNRYGVSVSQMTTDMFRLSSSQSGPFPIHDLSSGL